MRLNETQVGALRDAAETSRRGADAARERADGMTRSGLREWWNTVADGLLVDAARLEEGLPPVRTDEGDEYTGPTYPEYDD